MSAVLLAFPSLPVLAPGVWLYSHVPASRSDALLVVRVETDSGAAKYSILGGMRRLAPTRVFVRDDGGMGRERIVEHLTTESLRGYRESNGMTGYYGFLSDVYSDEGRRAEFIARCAAEPAYRAAEAKRQAEESERVRREVGPWFADVMGVIAPGIADTVQAKVLRRCLKELVGVSAKVTVRRYSMASGLNFGPRADAWTDADRAAILSIFPMLAWQTTRYDRESGTSCPWIQVSDDAHPRAHEDKSDHQSDYFDNGGFRIAPEYLLEVSRILGEEAV